MSNKKYIQSVRRAMIIMEYVAEKGSAKLIDIYQDLQLNKSTVFGILQTLEFEGYLIKDTNGLTYKLGLSSLSLGLSYMMNDDLNSKIHSLLEKVVEQVDETAYFVLKTQDKYYYLDYVLSSQPLKVVPEDGKFIELSDQTAVGQVFNHYQKQGFQYAKDLEDVYKGINCFAAPYMIGNKIAGCIVITGPSNRYTESKIEETYQVYKDVLKVL